MFQVAANAGLTVQNYGPFEPETVDTLAEAITCFEKGHSLPPMVLRPVMLTPKFNPTWVFFLNRLLFLHKRKVVEVDWELFRSAVVTEARIGDWGDYLVLHCPSIESVFVSHLDFSRSSFQMVSRSTIALSPSAPWSVLECICDVSSMSQLNSRKGHQVLDVMVVTNAQMTRSWDSKFFVFDGRTYLSTAALQSAPDLLLTEAKCDLHGPAT